MAADGIPLGTRKQHYPRDSTQKRKHYQSDAAISKLWLEKEAVCLRTPFRSVGLELGSAFDG